MFRALDFPTLAVFSHPNHELAVFGLVQRLKPLLIFLTDGGGQHRVDETKDGLLGLGLLENATFLPYTEQSFYDAIRQGDAEFFLDVADRLRSIFQRDARRQIICDAVEFYNPVHDMTLPLVLSAGAGGHEVFEVPLIHQVEGGQFEVQTTPKEFRVVQSEVTLTEIERGNKRGALQFTYQILRETMGQILLASPHALEKEVVFPAQFPLRLPGSSCFLRYEQRAKLLKSEGKIEEEITYEDHYVPLVRGIIGG